MDRPGAKGTLVVSPAHGRASARQLFVGQSCRGVVRPAEKAGGPDLPTGADKVPA